MFSEPRTWERLSVQTVLHTCKATGVSYHLQTLPSHSSGTLLAPPSWPHSFTRGPEQRVASNHSSPPHPAAHLHHTSRHWQVYTQFNSFEPITLQGSFAARFLSVPSNHQTLCFVAPVTKQKMACHQVTPRWARRVQASPCTPPFPRAREESPSSTVRTRTTTCRPRRPRATPPSQAKGETGVQRQKEWGGESMYSMFSGEILPSLLIPFLFSTFSVSTSLRHTAEDFIVTPFAQVSLT